MKPNCLNGFTSSCCYDFAEDLRWQREGEVEEACDLQLPLLISIHDTCEGPHTLQTQQKHPTNIRWLVAIFTNVLFTAVGAHFVISGAFCGAVENE